MGDHGRVESRGRPRWWLPYVPFVLVAVLGLVVLGWPFRDVERPGWDAAAVLAVALSLLSGVVVLRPGFRYGALRLLPPMIFLLAVVCFRQADSGSTSAFTALVGVPVLWLALYGSLRQVWVSVVGVAIVTGTPLVLVGSPDYPPDDWPRALLWTAFAALVGPLTNGVVSSRAASAARIRALEPADSRLRGLLSAATEHAIVGTDLEGTITVLSPGAEAILGWSEAEVSGKLPFVAVFRVRELGRRGHAIGVPPGFEVLVHAARSGVAECQDWTWIARDGEHRTVSLAINGVRNSYGELTGFIGIATDVTAARRTQAALASQQQVQGLLVDHLPNTVVGLVDADLRWVRVAGNWLTERGHDPTAFGGGLLGERLLVHNADGLRAMVKDAFAASRNGEFETQRGEWFDIAAVPVNGPTGEPLVLLVCRDVTSRHEVDRERTEMISALTSSEEGFRTAFENAPVGIALTSVEQGPDAVFLRVNKAFAALVGRTPEEIADTPIDALTHPEDIGQRPAFDAGTRQSYRTRYVTTAGRPLWVEVHASLVHDAAGAPSYVIAHVEDVTARRQSERALFDALEQQRAAAEALQEIDRVRVDTMSTISHELRTPLTSVEGYLEILADGGAGPLTEDQDRMVGVVRRNADRLGRLVDDLLELSRLEAMPTGEA
ncbi:MAG: hypothetical protein JWO46_3299, partial [Nocardioidaceae bacterium]|nr:hypothetical protein [Nocardioidaceae bacterium]